MSTPGTPPPHSEETPPPSEQKNSTGTTGFVFSILGLLTCGLLGPVAAVISGLGLRREPKTLAIIGLILGLVETLLIIPIAGVLVSIAVPSFLRAREMSRRNACQENLAQIDGAKQQWALEENVAASAAPDWDDLVGPSKYLRQEPSCPAEGTYTINPVGEDPSCSLSNQPQFPHVFPTSVNNR